MLKLELRPQESQVWRYASPLLALAITVALGIGLFMLLGKDPLRGLQRCVALILRKGGFRRRDLFNISCGGPRAQLSATVHAALSGWRFARSSRCGARMIAGGQIFFGDWI